MIVERSRGCLSTSGGTLARLGEDALPERMARRLLTLSNNMIRLGAAQVSETERSPDTRRRTADLDDAIELDAPSSRWTRWRSGDVRVQLVFMFRSHHGASLRGQGAFKAGAVLSRAQHDRRARPVVLPDRAGRRSSLSDRMDGTR